jgi:hypothetical protein
VMMAHLAMTKRLRRATRLQMHLVMTTGLVTSSPKASGLRLGTDWRSRKGWDSPTENDSHSRMVSGSRLEMANDSHLETDEGSARVSVSQLV